RTERGRAAADAEVLRLVLLLPQLPESGNGPVRTLEGAGGIGVLDPAVSRDVGEPVAVQVEEIHEAEALALRKRPAAHAGGYPRRLAEAGDAARAGELAGTGHFHELHSQARGADLVAARPAQV